MATVLEQKILTQKQKDRRRHLLIYAGLTPFVFMAVFPIYWMLITAFKQDPDLYRMDNIPFWFNLAPTLKHFKILFYQTNYGAWIINTMTIAAWVAVITLVTAVPAGYALARLRLPGAENIGISVFMKTSARPRNGRASRRASPRPSASLTAQVTAAKTTVMVAARQNAGSVASRR